MKIKLAIGDDSSNQKTAIKTVLTKLFSKWSKPSFFAKKWKIGKKRRKKRKKFCFGGNIVKSEKIISNIKPHLKKQLKHSKPSTSSSASVRDRFVSCLKERKKKKHKKEGWIFPCCRVSTLKLSRTEHFLYFENSVSDN